MYLFIISVYFGFGKVSSTSLSNLFSLVVMLNSFFKSCFFNAPIILYYFLIEFILRSSIIASEKYKLPEPVTKRARHLILLTFIMTTGKITLDLVEANIGSGASSERFSQICKLSQSQCGVYICRIGPFGSYGSNRHNVWYQCS